MEKTVQMSDFISYAVSLLWVKLCYGILLRNVMFGEQGRAGSAANVFTKNKYKTFH